MSFYINVNGWSGNDQDDAALRFGKVFRMRKVEADSTMSQISQGLPWQFDRRTSDDQSGIAKDYLTSLGFEVELTPVSAMDALDLSVVDDLPSEFEEVTKVPETPGRKPKSKLKFSKAGMAVILLLLAAGGLSQTQFGKDLIGKIGSQANEALNKSAKQPDVKKDSPVAPTPQPAGTDAQKNQPAAKPLQRIVIEGQASKTYPLILSGCKEGDNQMNLLMRRADLEQTQSDLLCQVGTIANPAGEWQCEFQPGSKLCSGESAYSCAMQYQCIPETDNYNKARFKREIEALS